jgi:hypothetical protein
MYLKVRRGCFWVVVLGLFTEPAGRGAAGGLLVLVELAQPLALLIVGVEADGHGRAPWATFGRREREPGSDALGHVRQVHHDL